MSAIAAHHALPAARRFTNSVTHNSDQTPFLQYPQLSLNAVTLFPAHRHGSYYLGSSAGTSLSSGPPWAAICQVAPSAPVAVTSTSLSLPSRSESPYTSPHIDQIMTAYPQDRHGSPSNSSSDAYYDLRTSPTSSTITSATSKTPRAPEPYSAFYTPITNDTSHQSPESRRDYADWADSTLYTLEPSDSGSVVTAPSSPALRSASQDHIAAGDGEEGFIFAICAPSEPPPATLLEVPLRNCHAPPEMRSMMHVFRLDNFAIHDGLNPVAIKPGSGGIEVGPLKEVPVEFEWQLQLCGSPLSAVDDPCLEDTLPRAPRHVSLEPTSERFRADPPNSIWERSQADYPWTGGASSPATSDVVYREVPKLQCSDNNGTYDTPSSYGRTRRGVDPQPRPPFPTASTTFSSAVAHTSSTGECRKHHDRAGAMQSLVSLGVPPRCQSSEDSCTSVISSSGTWRLTVSFVRAGRACSYSPVYP